MLNLSVKDPNTGQWEVLPAQLAILYINSLMQKKSERASSAALYAWEMINQRYFKNNGGQWLLRQRSRNVANNLSSK